METRWRDELLSETLRDVPKALQVTVSGGSPSGGSLPATASAVRASIISELTLVDPGLPHTFDLNAEEYPTGRGRLSRATVLQLSAAGLYQKYRKLRVFARRCCIGRIRGVLLVSPQCDGTDLTAKVQEMKLQCLLFLNIPRYAEVGSKDSMWLL